MAGAGTALVAPASSAPAPMVVASKLNNPRGITFGPFGGLYVAEAGRGGRKCSKDGCIGYTSGVARIVDSALEGRVGRRIFSGAGPDGSFAGGATDVVFDSQNRPVVVTNGVPPSGVPKKARRQSAQIARVHGRRFTTLARVDAIEKQQNPDGQDVNPNPYGVERIGGTFYVMDAGGNDVLAVDERTRKVSVAAVIPNPAKKVQPVPTAITVGPDGALYIAELAPGPNVGEVIRLVPGGQPTAVATGLPSATGIAIGPDGSIYLSLFGEGGEETKPFSGSVLKIAPDGARSTIAGGLNFPAGITIGPDGDLYVANNSVLGSRAAKSGPFKGETGEIIKIDLP